MAEFLVRSQPAAQHFHTPFMRPDGGSIALLEGPSLGLEIASVKAEERRERHVPHPKAASVQCAAASGAALGEVISPARSAALGCLQRSTMAEEGDQVNRVYAVRVSETALMQMVPS